MILSKIGRDFFLTCTVLCFSSGCGGGDIGQAPVAHTTGVVTYKGSPLQDAEVIFVPEKISQTANGRTNASGEFTMTTYNTNDGAVVALNQVLVVSAPLASTSSFDMSKVGNDEEAQKKAYAEYQKQMINTPRNANSKKEAGPSSIPQKYSDVKSTPLKFTVVAGEKNHFKIELKD